MSLVYDIVVREVFENRKGRYVNALDYLQVLQKAHIFMVSESMVEGICVQENLKDILNDAVMDNKICMPFDNMWFEFEGVQTTFDRPDPEIKSARRGIHFVRLDTDEKESVNIYGVQTFVVYNLDDGQYVVPHSVAFFLKKMKLNVFQRWMFKQKMAWMGAGFGASADYCVGYIWSMFASEVCEQPHTFTAEKEVEALFFNKMLRHKQHGLFCQGNDKRCRQRQVCAEARITAYRSMTLAIGLTGWINLPVNYTIKVSPVLSSAELKYKQKGIKPYGWRREHYIVIEHDKLKTVNPNINEIETLEHHKKRGHARRGHKRYVPGRMYKGKFIRYRRAKQWVRPTWVGPREWLFKQNFYKLVK